MSPSTQKYKSCLLKKASPHNLPFYHCQYIRRVSMHVLQVIHPVWRIHSFEQNVLHAIRGKNVTQESVKILHVNRATLQNKVQERTEILTTCLQLDEKKTVKWCILTDEKLVLGCKHVTENHYASLLFKARCQKVCSSQGEWETKIFKTTCTLYVRFLPLGW
jgi:hypothetical protein